jgi:hypothetical protein
MFKRFRLANAMRRDGFSRWEVKAALRLYDAGRERQMEAYCRSVVSDIARRKANAARKLGLSKWTQPDAYQSASSSNIASNRA